MNKRLIHKQKMNFKRDIYNSTRKSEAIISHKNKVCNRETRVHHLTYVIQLSITNGTMRQHTPR